MNQISNLAEHPQQSEKNQFYPSIDDWQKLPAFLKKHPQFNIEQMRWLLLHRKTNGLSEHIRKIGRPIYINVPGFLQWIFERKER